MNIPDNLLYSADHEWVRIEDGKATIGITDYAQDVLGDVVFVDTPNIGGTVTSGEAITEVESTKSVSDIFAPVDGVILEMNQELTPKTGKERGRRGKQTHSDKLLYR